MWVPKRLLTPIKIWICGPKSSKNWSKICIFGHFGPNIAFFAHFVQCPTKNQCEEGVQVVFRYVGNKTFDFSSKKIGFFAQKQPNLAQNWHFCLLLAHSVPCWWVGWWLWRGLYLARHLFTLYIIISPKNWGAYK